MNRDGWTRRTPAQYVHTSGWKIEYHVSLGGRWTVADPDGTRTDLKSYDDPERAAADAERAAAGVRRLRCGKCQRNDGRTWACVGCGTLVCAHKGGGDESGIPGIPHVVRCPTCRKKRRG